MNSLQALQEAGDAFVALAIDIDAAELGQPSTCDEWTIGELIDHVTRGCRMTVTLMNGASAVQATAERDQPFDGPLIQALTAEVDHQLQAFATKEMRPEVIHHPVADMTPEQLVGIRLVEFVVHHWDLARSLRVDHQIESSHASLAWETMAPLAGVTASLGMFGDGSSGLAGASNDPLELLLDATGRRP